jgi:uncharacterized protein with gpF-like domain
VGYLVNKIIERSIEAIEAKYEELEDRLHGADVDVLTCAEEFARAVIAAMREPTYQMVEAAYSGSDFQAASEREIRSGWRSMIEAVLDNPSQITPHKAGS